jgi:hypothetical protein
MSSIKPKVRNYTGKSGNLLQVKVPREFGDRSITSPARIDRLLIPKIFPIDVKTVEGFKAQRVIIYERNKIQSRDFFFIDLQLLFKL